MPPRFPVFWVTLLLFILVAASTRDALVGGIHLIIILPLVILGQWCLRWVFRRFHSPVWLRRSAMLLPALFLAANLFITGGSDTQALRVAFAGNIPAGIRDLHIHEDAWNDYVVTAYFRCDPASLRAILERPPFARSSYQPEHLYFSATEFPGLDTLPDFHGIITFERTDMKKVTVAASCRRMPHLALPASSIPWIDAKRECLKQHSTPQESEPKGSFYRLTSWLDQN